MCKNLLIVLFVIFQLNIEGVDKKGEEAQTIAILAQHNCKLDTQKSLNNSTGCTFTGTTVTIRKKKRKNNSLDKLKKAVDGLKKQ